MCEGTDTAVLILLVLPLAELNRASDILKTLGKRVTGVTRVCGRSTLSGHMNSTCSSLHAWEMGVVLSSSSLELHERIKEREEQAFWGKDLAYHHR